MTHRQMATLSVLAALAMAPSSATSGEASPTGNLRSLHTLFFRDIAAAAEQVGADGYDFRPTPDVRTYGELIGHIAQASFALCAIARGVDAPAESRTIEERATDLGKGGLARELMAAREYCDATFGETNNAGATSERGTAALSDALFEGQSVSTAGVLAFQVAHIADHWGNLVTYLRLLGEVPPSTARAQAARDAADS